MVLQMHFGLQTCPRNQEFRKKHLREGVCVPEMIIGHENNSGRPRTNRGDLIHHGLTAFMEQVTRTHMLEMGSGYGVCDCMNALLEGMTYSMVTNFGEWGGLELPKSRVCYGVLESDRAMSNFDRQPHQRSRDSPTTTRTQKIPVERTDRPDESKISL